VTGETLHGLADIRAEGVFTDPQRPGELAVFLGDADGNRGCNDDVAVVGGGAGLGDGLGGEHVSPERGMGTVLFGRTDWQDREVATGGVGGRPRNLGEMHTPATIP
jgi:hypothetical protein